MLRVQSAKIATLLPKKLMTAFAGVILPPTRAHVTQPRLVPRILAQGEALEAKLAVLAKRGEIPEAKLVEQGETLKRQGVT